MKSGPLLILLVEDNPGHAKLIMRSFENFQIANKIVHVTDGDEAMDYLFRKGKFAGPDQTVRPDLILLDLRIPKIDGIEVLKIIKNDKSLLKIPVVILTTSETESDIDNAYSNNANSYLVKPVDFAKFTQLMKDIGFYWLGWNINPGIE